MNRREALSAMVAAGAGACLPAYSSDSQYTLTDAWSDDGHVLTLTIMDQAGRVVRTEIKSVQWTVSKDGMMTITCEDV